MPQLRYLPTLPSLLLNRREPFIQRDLSWLQFNERVLDEARSSSNPLLERLKFLAITASNLDEFFMIRYRFLSRAERADKRMSPPTAGASITEVFLENVSSFTAKQGETFELLSSELAASGIQLIRATTPGDPYFEIGREIFNREIFPLLSPPERLSPSQLSQLENFQLGVVVANSWFKIPKVTPVVFVGPAASDASHLFFLLDDLLITHLPTAFNLNGSAALLRLTRDGDFSVEMEDDDPESIPDSIISGIKRRDSGKPTRLQYCGDVSSELVELACRQCGLQTNQVFPAPVSVVLSGLWTIVRHVPEGDLLTHPPLRPCVPPALRDASRIFEAIRERDYLLHHPYDSFETYVSWISAAAEDPAVLSIQQTVYRTDASSAVVAALMRGARRGKRVRVVIELRARFDELNNLKLAQELREAGVEVFFGLPKLKIHAKVALVERREGEIVRPYTHLSTGNYSATTARLYTDLSILSANGDLGDDARRFFDAVCKGSVPSNFKKMVTAPTQLHKILISRIEHETNAAQEGRKARIVAKVNALVDPPLIESLYRASQAGVHVDLIVRGACALIPGVKGLSERIKVVSVVDRFLEHSRIYYFGDAKELYLSSADWMPRNFFSRLEIAFPVQDPRIARFITEEILPSYLKDTVKGRELTSQGTWKKRSPRAGSPAVRAQFHLEKLALQEYAGTALAELSSGEREGVVVGSKEPVV